MTRLRHLVTVSWEIFSRKVSGGLLPINKEASMQLQYAYLLQQMLPLTIHEADEQAHIELETTITHTDGSRNNVDIVIVGKKGDRQEVIAVELKYYRRLSSSGGNRGGQDIFKKAVYEDLEVLERYVSSGYARHGVLLVMTDMKGFVEPLAKVGKAWGYDISHGHRTNAGEAFEIPVGGKPVSIRLERSYFFDWRSHGQTIWFAELEGMSG